MCPFFGPLTRGSNLLFFREETMYVSNLRTSIISYRFGRPGRRALPPIYTIPVFLFDIYHQWFVCMPHCISVISVITSRALRILDVWSIDAPIYI